VSVEQRQEGDRSFTTWRHGGHTLTSVWERSHPVKYPVDSLEAVRVWRSIWEGARFFGHDDREPLATLDRLIGNDGVVTRFWGPSTIPRLLEEDMGLETFYYLLADHADELDGLIRLMHERELEAFRLMAAGPWDSVTLVENTSTAYISRSVYERYNMPHQRDFVARTRQGGKVALLHMCGHVHGLLDLIKETACDGIHTLTPLPTGDCPWERALEVIGDDLVIIGCLDPTIFAGGPVDQIGPALDRLITPRLRDSHFVLGPMADGLPIDLVRFQAVQRWMERNADPRHGAAPA